MTWANAWAVLVAFVYLVVAWLIYAKLSSTFEVVIVSLLIMLTFETSLFTTSIVVQSCNRRDHLNAALLHFVPGPSADSEFTEAAVETAAETARAAALYTRRTWMYAPTGLLAVTKLVLASLG